MSRCSDVNHDETLRVQDLEMSQVRAHGLMFLCNVLVKLADMSPVCVCVCVCVQAW